MGSKLCLLAEISGQGSVVWWQGSGAGDQRAGEVNDQLSEVRDQRSGIQRSYQKTWALNPEP